MAMNDHQRAALENHCRFAFETGNPLFVWIDRKTGASVLLSVNSGYE